MTARTTRDFELHGVDIEDVRELVSDGLLSHSFKVVYKNCDGSSEDYDSPPMEWLRGTTFPSRRFEVGGPPGRVVGLNTTYAPLAPQEPLVFSILPAAMPAGLAGRTRSHFPVHRSTDQLRIHSS